MNLVTLDFETYWSDTHTLKKMSNIEYATHPDTEIISCSIKVGSGFTEVWFGNAQIRQAFDEIDWGDAFVVGHNMSEFDALLLAWRFGIKPKMWGCTMAMARPIHAKTTGLSLGALVQHYGIGVKDNTALVQTKGKRLKEFDPFELEAMRRYNKADTEQCYALFHALRLHYTAKELQLIDSTIRAMVEPKFVLDHELLEKVLVKVRADKKAQLVELAGKLPGGEEPEGALIDWGNEDEVAEFVRSELASAPKFSALLGKLGVEVPTKPSPTNPEKMIPALSKTDQEFLALQDHENPAVAAAARCRLGVKSVQLETRIEAFLKACDATEGYLPVPLKYCGADTTGRWSGYTYNPQNLPRINPTKRQLSDALRLSIQAPAGHTIIVADQSGIELRVNHFLWKVESSMQLYQKDPQADLYRAFAAVRYGIPPEQVDKMQRQLAKVAQLGLGFGAAWRTFQQVAKVMGGLDLTDDEAMEIVLDWRRQYPEIVKGWETCHAALPHIEAGREREIDPWGLCHTSAHGIHLPSGRIIRYPELRYEEDENGKRREWVYGRGRHKARIYAGKITENIVQALARDTVADAAVEFRQLTGLSFSLMVHDELVYVVPKKQAVDMLSSLQCIMRKPPKWWPQLVTWSEGDAASRYGLAK